MSQPISLVLVVGGTGAQGVPVVQALAADSKYQVRVLSRNANSAESKALASLQGVTIFEGDSYNEADLRGALKGATHMFANTNGFAIGEKNEIYWGIRMYELAREAGVTHFLYAGLEYASKLGNFDPKYRCGHLDGKGKVVDYISAQSKTPMAWSVVTSCLYIQGLSEILRPFPSATEPGTMVFKAPLGTGKLPLINLDDYGLYARWIFDIPSRSNGLELHARVFTEVTGKKATYQDVTLDDYFKLGIFKEPDGIVGHSVETHDRTLFTYRQNFSGFWNTWKDDLTKRDYALLDEILPSRVKSVKEWMVKTGYTGEPKSVLKDYRDGQGRRTSSK